MSLNVQNEYLNMAKWIPESFGAVFDGLRGHYATKGYWRESAGFQAAMAMACVSILPIIATFILVDYAIHRNTQMSIGLTGNKIFLAVVALGTGCGHVFLAKRTGRYVSVQPAKSTSWKKYLTIYIGCSVLFAAWVLWFVV
jgi:hypothetical protein